MSKTKYQRGLCVFYGCQNPGTVEPNDSQRFCQRHIDEFQQIQDHHEKMMAEIHERGARKLAERDRRERRLLFFAAMRQPEMRWLREAFKHLRNDTRHDWREIREIEIDPPIQIDGYSGAWAMRTDRFVTLLHYPERYDGHEDFMTVDHHDANNAYCECWWCYDATMEKRRAESEVTNG